MESLFFMLSLSTHISLRLSTRMSGLALSTEQDSLRNFRLPSNLRSNEPISLDHYRVQTKGSLSNLHGDSFI